MKIINLDELEQKCINWGLRNEIFKEEDLNKKNLFTVSFRGTYHSKTFDLLYLPTENIITLYADTWEDLYYQINEFFR